MANFTKQAIKDSFVRLLHERPYSKITVQNIADDCGINRNSFYYHFPNIPALTREIVREETARIIGAYSSIGSIETCASETIRLALEHRRAVLHVYHSVNRSTCEQFLWDACGYSVRTYLRSAFPNAAIAEEDQNFLVRYYTCMCFGIVSDWLENGMREDLQAEIRRLCEWKKGQTEDWIRRCAER